MSALLTGMSLTGIGKYRSRRYVWEFKPVLQKMVVLKVGLSAYKIVLESSTAQRERLMQSASFQRKGQAIKMRIDERRRFTILVDVIFKMIM